jgi:hypothetical protein
LDLQIEGALKGGGGETIAGKYVEQSAAYPLTLTKRATSSHVSDEGFRIDPMLLATAPYPLRQFFEQFCAYKRMWVADLSLATVGSYANGMVVFNPSLLSTFTRVAQVYWLTHQCAHASLSTLADCALLRAIETSGSMAFELMFTLEKELTRQQSVSWHIPPNQMRLQCLAPQGPEVR